MFPVMHLDELDRTLCELDDAQPGPAITRREWGLAEARGKQLDFNGLNDAPGQPHVNASAAGVSRSPGPPSSLAGGSFASSPGSPPGVITPPHKAEPPAIVLCLWCAMERAANRQGPAPRAGVCLRVGSCERHGGEPGTVDFAGSSREVVTEHSPTAGAAVAAQAVNRAPVPFNPNAGERPAFPKGRWL